MYLSLPIRGRVETKLQATVNRIFGVFQLAGCKGYPEPFKAGLEGELRRSNRLQFLTYPHFRNTAFTEQRFIKDRSLANSSPSDLAIRTIMGGSNFTEIMGKEFGRFRVTYPTQITLFDRLFWNAALFPWQDTDARCQRVICGGIPRPHPADGHFSSVLCHRLVNARLLHHAGLRELREGRHKLSDSFGNAGFSQPVGEARIEIHRCVSKRNGR